MKKNLFINIVLWLFVTVILILTGMDTINKKTIISEKESSFTLTDFDYVILSPSTEQVDELKSKSEAITNIFPCVCFDASLKGNLSSKIDLLLSDRMEDYSISLFNDKTLIEGKYEENCLQLDKTAADNLGVKVGDMVSFSLGIRAYSLKVCAIYMASTYTQLDQGLALAKLTDEIKSGFEVRLSYDYAFIDATDLDKCIETLSTYKPLGKLQTLEEYMADEKSKNTCPPTLTEEQWNEQIKNGYLEYKDRFLSQDFGTSVQNKLLFMEDVKEQTTTLSNKINKLSYSIALGAIVIYFILTIVFINLNYKADKENNKDGVSSNSIRGKYLLQFISGAVLISLITFGVLTFYAKNNQFYDDLRKIIYIYSFSILISLVIVIIYILIHCKKFDDDIVIVKESKEEIKNKVNLENSSPAPKVIEQKEVTKDSNSIVTSKEKKSDQSFKVHYEVTSEKSSTKPGTYDLSHKKVLVPQQTKAKSVEGGSNVVCDSSRRALKELKTKVLYTKTSDGKSVGCYYVLNSNYEFKIILKIDGNLTKVTGYTKKDFLKDINSKTIYIYKNRDDLDEYEKKFLCFDITNTKH